MPKKKKKAKKEELAVDPVCGMKVNVQFAKKKGLVSRKKGKTYYFCSKDCKKDFTRSTIEKYIPLMLGVVLSIFAIIAILTGYMFLYMGIFFVAVSLLKMPDWKGFVKAFSTYDLIARNFRFYSWIYPAIEFALGILYLTRLSILPTAIVTFIIMSVGAIGVTQNLLRKNPLRCACLGTLINIPLTKFTLFEDVLMAVMAILIIVL